MTAPNLGPVNLATPAGLVRNRNYNTLEQMPKLRDPQWAKRDKSDILDSRRDNMEAALITSRGVVQLNRCAQCVIKGGTFTECVVVPGMYNGSCGNCKFNVEGGYCTFASKSTEIP
jgi:hypothetical protein